MNRQLADFGFTFSGPGSVDLRSTTCFGFKVVEPLVLDIANTELAPGYVGNLSGLSGVTLPVGDYPMRLSKVTLTSGSGFFYLEG